jgi:thioredoxin reductase (NADPH)
MPWGAAYREKESRCDSVYSALGVRGHSELAQDADLDADGDIQTDPHQMTNIEGL